MEALEEKARCIQEEIQYCEQVLHSFQEAPAGLKVDVAVSHFENRLAGCEESLKAVNAEIEAAKDTELYIVMHDDHAKINQDKKSLRIFSDPDSAQSYAEKWALEKYESYQNMDVMAQKGWWRSKGWRSSYEVYVKEDKRLVYDHYVWIEKCAMAKDG